MGIKGRFLTAHHLVPLSHITTLVIPTLAQEIYSSNVIHFKLLRKQDALKRSQRDYINNIMTEP